MELNGPDLKWPAVLAVGAVLALLIAYAVHLRLARRSTRASAAVANSEALTRLPEYQRALRLHRIRMAVLALSAVLLAGAALVGAARPLDTVVDKPQARNRDILLCLDISGSMAAYDATLVSTFKTLVKSFEGERIGLVIFNSSAATVFPLTDDYDFINDELDTAGRALAGGSESDSFFAGTFNGRGTSLIGDGLATCVSSFDKVDTQRARSVVFATDNHLAGRPIIDVEQAIELAKAKGVRVYGLNPEEDGPDEEAVQMRELVTGTGGHYYAMSDQSAIKGIVDAVEAQEATLVDAASRSLHSDNPALAIALAGVGLLVLVGASRRWAS
ncbi:VWA domain-containing protein [Terrabacter sp. NPDC080008]|uniref:VWA domain-containing protein n=1 Tax=Terrabacter sp. NPDC080008 TaxID=3155176 RepID=UPI00344B1C9C